MLQSKLIEFYKINLCQIIIFVFIISNTELKSEVLTANQFSSRLDTSVQEVQNRTARREALDSRFQELQTSVNDLNSEVAQTESEFNRFQQNYEQIYGTYQSNNKPINQIISQIESGVNFTGNIAVRDSRRQEASEGINTLVSRLEAFNRDVCSAPRTQDTNRCRDLNRSLERLRVMRTDCQNALSSNATRDNRRTCSGFIQGLSGQLNSTFELVKRFEERNNQLSSSLQQQRNSLQAAQAQLTTINAQRSNESESEPTVGDHLAGLMQELRDSVNNGYLDASILALNSKHLSRQSGLELAQVSEMLSQLASTLSDSLDDSLLGKYVNHKLENSLSCEKLSEVLNNCRATSQLPISDVLEVIPLVPSTDSVDEAPATPK